VFITKTQFRYEYCIFILNYATGNKIKKNGSTDSDVWLSALPTGADIHNETMPSGDE
jgi:hypothetical protein